MNKTTSEIDVLDERNGYPEILAFLIFAPSNSYFTEKGPRVPLILRLLRPPPRPHL